MTVNRSTKEIRLNKLLAGVNETVINSIFRIENFKEVKEGEIVYQSGDDSDFLYLLLRGDVKIKYPSHHYISNKIFNDFFGEKELSEKIRRNSSAVANSRCLLYLIERSTLEKIISKSPVVSKNIQTYGELELPEMEEGPKSSINLTNSDKPVSFRAIKPKKEPDSKKEVKKNPQEEDISDAISQIIEEENLNVDIKIDDDDNLQNYDDVDQNIGLDNEDEINAEESPVKEKNNEELKPQQDQINIQDVLNILNSIHDPLTVYETVQAIIHAIREATKSDAGEIYIIDEDSGEMQKFYNQNGMIKTSYKKISDGLTGTCALQKRILNFDKPSDDSRFIKDIDQPGIDGLKKIIYVPLITVDDVLIAVLQVARENTKYSELDVKLLESISEQLAVAILRSKRHEQIIEEEKQKVRDDLSMFLSDNIMVPVDIINRYTSLLNNEEFSEKVKEIISMLKKQANLFWDIIETTLDYNKMDFELDLKKNSLNSYIDSISEILSEYCDSREINLFKKAGENSSVMIDSGKLFMAIYQVIKNACDASEPGSNLYISTDKEEDFALISIRDEGNGISDDILEELFDSVYDEQKSRNRLGLVIAKRIISLHTGEISFKSKMMEGTTFELKLPVYTDEEPVSQHVNSESNFEDDETADILNVELNKNDDPDKGLEQ